MRKGVVVYLLVFFLYLGSPVSFTQHMHQEHQHESEEVGDLEEVGNTICPVSGEEIKEDERFEVAHEGKIYNFCCKMCAKDFKKDPEKYIEKLQELEEKQTEKHHEGHHH